MDIVVLSGSIRSSQRNLEKIKDISDASANIAEYVMSCKQEIEKGATYCNSDILVGITLLGIRLEGVRSIPFSLANLFSKSGEINNNQDDKYLTDNITVKNDELDSLLSKIKNCSGIVLITPVYFGDRSSVANKFIQLSGKYGFLKNKVFGAGTVGAKRNGGQETATLYCLFEALRHKGYVVGNGPPTSQYGGTAVGGHRGTVIDDEWGLTTTFGVASRVSQVAKLCQNADKSLKKDKVRILILVTMDDSTAMLLTTIEKLISKFKNDYLDTEFVIVDVTKLKIYRCLGCKYCPGKSRSSAIGKTSSCDNYASCIIKNKDDDMPHIQKELLQADGILIAGFNSCDAVDINYSYQVLIERTRYIRRDNFELTNKLISSLTLHEVGATVNLLHHFKTVTSYIRHNVIMCAPVDIYKHKGETILNGEDSFRQFIDRTKKIKNGRSKITLKSPKYVTSGIGGYE